MTPLKILSFLIVMAFISCNGTKNTEEVNKDKIAQKMMEEGFKKGNIIFSEEKEDCSYTIKVADLNEVYYDPINLDDSFKVHNEKVWFKFNGLMMKNRCLKANPVSISEIKKRAE